MKPRQVNTLESGENVGQEADALVQAYVEGDWLAIPVNSGGFALARIARKRGTALLVYAFGKRFAKPPTLADTISFSPSDAIKVARTGNLGIRYGTWLVIEQGKSNWKSEREDWPMPAFRQKNLFGDGWIRVDYKTDRPTDERSQMSFISFEEAKKLPDDGMHGHVAMENDLTALIDFVERKNIQS